jgi:hypothetical protein
MNTRIAFIIVIVAGLLALSLGSASARTAANTGNDFLGINLAGIADWTTEWPFVDAFKISRAWTSNRDGAGWGQGGPLSLTPEGWVASLAAGQRAITPIYISGYHPTGDYVILYDGEGEMAFPLFSNRIVSQSPGRIVLNIPNRNEGIWLEIRQTNPANPIRNIRFIMPGFEATYQQQPFHPLFLERLAGFGAIRFMDWMATNDSTVSQWSERPKLTDATWSIKGVPAEVMIQLANTLQADAWFTLPHLATDDYVQQLATLVRDRLAPGLKAYIEYSNETWNCQFEQCRYMGTQSARLGWGSNPYWDGALYHARRATEIFAIWEQVFGGRDRLVRVLASQAVNPALSERIVTWEDAYQKADALAIAPYFSTELFNGITLDQTLQGMGANLRGDIRNWIRDTQAVADRYGLRLLAYEAGQHLVAPTPWNDTPEMRAMTETAIAANRDPRIADLYLEYLRQWRALGGSLMMQFSSVGLYSRWGMWGALEYQDQPLEQAPKYHALMQFIIENQSAALLGDINGDGAVTLADFALLAAAFNKREGDADYNPGADLNADRAVTLADFALLASNFNQSRSS